MVRKVTCFVCLLVLIFGCAVTAQATTFVPYSSVNTSQRQQGLDLMAHVGFGEKYVLFVSGTSILTLAVGDIALNDTTFTADTVRLYHYASRYGPNQTTGFYKEDDSNFVLNVSNSAVVYSNLGDFPELESRGDKYAMLSAVLLFVFIIGIVVYMLLKPR